MVINLKKPVDKSRASNDSSSIYCLMFPGADLYLLCFYFLLWSFFFFVTQIECLLLHAQLRGFMKKGLKMLLYQHFLGSMVTYFELNLMSELLSLSDYTTSLRLFWIHSTISFFIAATIFAYGQTSSGKTFTMKGITENAIKDIYEYIKNVSYY